MRPIHEQDSEYCAQYFFWCSHRVRLPEDLREKLDVLIDRPVRRGTADAEAPRSKHLMRDWQ